MWDFNDVIQWTGKRGIEWVLVPTGGQHFNGLAERMIGLIKKQIWRSFEGKINIPMRRLSPFSRRPLK
jgi:hypothetical protein